MVLATKIKKGKEMAEIKVQAVRKTIDGDLKTQLARNKVKVMEEGQQGTLLKSWSNLYGNWCRVRLDNGEVLDVSPADIKII